MDNIRTIGKQWKIYLFLVILLTGFLLLYSTNTSPFYPYTYGYDSAFFRAIGTMILKGKTIYKDIWDHKGPVFYFIQAIGALHGTRNEKISLIFIMQIFNLLASFHFMNLIDIEISKQKRSIPRFLFLTISTIAVFCNYIIDNAGNLTEEWSLSLISCSLYLFVKYAFQTTNTPLHPRRYAFYHGMIFALLAFIRLNNAVSVCAGIAIIGIFLIYKRQWRNIAENILFGLMGIAVISIPVFAYFLWKHALKDMLFAIFTFNLKYNGNKTIGRISKANFFPLYLPVITSILLFLIHLIRNKRMTLIDFIAIAIICANGALFTVNNIYRHYFIIYIPTLLFVLILYAKMDRIPERILTICFFVYFLAGAKDVALLNINTNYNPAFPTLNLYLPKSERKSAIAVNAIPEVYLNTGIEPCSRFAANQSLIFSVIPEFEEEFKTAIQTEKPKWILTYCRGEDTLPFIRELIENQYEYKFSDSPYCFYRVTEPIHEISELKGTQ